MWIHNGKEFTEDDINDSLGFVYLITNLITGKKYVGKKIFTFVKTTQVKLKKKRTRVRSDWETYFGSNDGLKGDVAAGGETNFKREILHLCKTKGECNYLEAREIFDRRALERSDYYNGWMSVRVARSHIKNLQNLSIDNNIL
jgi:hypothetical protein